MKKLLCSLVAVSMLASALPVAAATGETIITTKAPAATTPGSLQTAIKQVASRVELAPSAAVAADPQSNPLTSPSHRSSQVRRQGRGSAAMVIGIVSTLAGVAGTVYMVKMMQKSTSDQTKQ